jgi:hypothetical protein
MSAAAKEKREVTLPEGVSLRRVAEVLLDAWEADPRRWMNAPMALREGAPKPAMPVPQDAMDLFRLLAGRRVDYLLVGGMAMLTYVKGRNTKDVDLLMSVAALEQLPELAVEERDDFFCAGKIQEHPGGFVADKKSAVQNRRGKIRHQASLRRIVRSHGNGRRNDSIKALRAARKARSANGFNGVEENCFRRETTHREGGTRYTKLNGNQRHP